MVRRAAREEDLFILRNEANFRLRFKENVRKTKPIGAIAPMNEADSTSFAPPRFAVIMPAMGRKA